MASLSLSMASLSRDLILILTGSLERNISQIRILPCSLCRSDCFPTPHTDNWVTAIPAQPTKRPLWPPSPAPRLATHSPVDSSTWLPRPAPAGWSTESAESSGEKSQHAGEISARLTNQTVSSGMPGVFAQRDSQGSSPHTKGRVETQNGRLLQ